MDKLLVENVYKETKKYLEKMPKEKRKEIGQFFTSIETARFMASIFSEPQQEFISVLDPGAGSGILTAAVIEYLQKYKKVKRVKITCYETSKDVLPILKKNLKYLKRNSMLCLDYEIKEENYITSQKDDFNNQSNKYDSSNKYDIVISNPPYKKIAKTAVEAVSMPCVCYGAPNLYFLFAAMSLFNLDKNGEMVYIIPRSWTSGAYFQKFREYLFKEGSIKQIHLFVSRDKVFEEENVLQETIIIKINKLQKKENIKITCSESNSNFNEITSIEVPYELVVVGQEKFVCLVTTPAELTILQTISNFKNTFSSIGFKMRTGLTVAFRNSEYLSSESTEETIPLLYSQHIKNGRIVFPIHRENEYITTKKTGLIQKNKNYLFVKRFTTKEEKRRLQSGIYLSKDFSMYQYISTDNKINFIEGIGIDLSIKQVYGLYVIFNSTIYDQYYRILNGSTQVNSTEINAMPVPSLIEIEQLGDKLIKENNLSVEFCDELLGGIINEQNQGSKGDFDRIKDADETTN